MTIGQKYERFSRSKKPYWRGQWCHEVRIIKDITSSHVLYELEKENQEGTIVETELEIQQVTTKQWNEWVELARLVKPIKNA